MNLATYLKRYELTFEAFAALVGKNVPAQAIHRYAHFLSYPRPDRANKIVKVTNGEVTFTDLFKKRKSK